MKNVKTERVGGVARIERVEEVEENVGAVQKPEKMSPASLKMPALMMLMI